MSDKVTVRFTKQYCAPCGAAIRGVTDEVKEFNNSEQLQSLLNDGTLEPVATGAAKKRKKATAKKRSTR